MFAEAKGLSWCVPLAPISLRGPPCLAPPEPGLVLGFGPPWAWKVLRPRSAGRCPGEEIPSGCLGPSAREGGRTLTASPEAKGNLPRDPHCSAKQAIHLGEGGGGSLTLSWLARAGLGLEAETQWEGGGISKNCKKNLDPGNFLAGVWKSHSISH